MILGLQTARNDSSIYLLSFVVGCVLIVADLNTNLFDSVKRGLSAAVYAPLQAMTGFNNVATMVEFFLGSKQDLASSLLIAQQQVAYLQSRSAQFKTIVEENNKLRDLVDFESRFKKNIQIAEVAFVKIGRNSQYFFINKGLDDDVYISQSIIDSQGLVGQVVEVFPSHSKVMLVTSANFGVPASILGKGFHINLQGKNSNLLYADNILRDIPIEVGDSLITSGLGAVYPKGLPVAVVESIEVENENWSYSLTAKPASQLTRGDFVFLVKTQQEQIPAMDSALSP